MRQREQVGGRYRFGALLAKPVTPAVQALHRGFHLEKSGASGGQTLRRLASLETEGSRSHLPRLIVNHGETFHLLPPQILQLFSQTQTFQRRERTEVGHV